MKNDLLNFYLFVFLGVKLEIAIQEENEIEVSQSYAIGDHQGIIFSL